MSSDVAVLTYDDLAKRLAITRESARQLVIRKRWTRSKGNDGRARVHVPFDILETARTSATPSITPSDTGADTSGSTGHDTSHTPSITPSHTGADTSLVTALTRHVERLEAALDVANTRIDTLERERDAERARAAELPVKVAELATVKIMLDTERQRVEELRADRDHSRTQADHLEGELAGLRQKAAEHDVLAVQLETLKVALEESRWERDRWATQAHALAHAPSPPAAPVMQRRGFLGWFRRAG